MLQREKLNPIKTILELWNDLLSLYFLSMLHRIFKYVLGFQCRSTIIVLQKQQGTLQLYNSFGTPLKILDASYYYISKTYGDLTTFHYKNVFKISHSYHLLLFLQYKDKNLRCENSIEIILGFPFLSCYYHIVSNGSSHNFSIASCFIASLHSFPKFLLLIEEYSLPGLFS